MTYREFLAKLQSFTQDKLDDDVILYHDSDDEYFAIDSLEVKDGDNLVLKDGQRYLVRPCFEKRDWNQT